MTGILTALGNRWESRIATLLEGSREVQIVRRCADLADLVATAAAGLGSVALVSSDLRGLDLSAVASLRAAGVQVVGVATPDASDGAVAVDDEDAERRLRQLGIDRVVTGGADLAAFEAVLADAAGSEPADLGDLALLDRDLGAGSRPQPPSAPLDANHDAHNEDGAGRPAPAEADQPPGRLIAVWGPTGAPGRTTIAVTLASELAVLGVRPSLSTPTPTEGRSPRRCPSSTRRPASPPPAGPPTKARSTCPCWPGSRRPRRRGYGSSPAYPRPSGGPRSGRPPWNASSPSADSSARSSSSTVASTSRTTRS